MTIEEWTVVDKTPGTRFRTSDGKIGKLVSVHKDGATLDFTNGETYTHVVRGFYRCVQLSDPDAPPTEKEDSKPRKYSVRKVMRVKTGAIYKTVAEAARTLHVSDDTIRKSAGLGITPKRGKYAGESFMFV